MLLSVGFKASNCCLCERFLPTPQIPSALSPLPHPLQGCAAAYFSCAWCQPWQPNSSQETEWAGSPQSQDCTVMAAINRSVKLLPLAHVEQCLWETL